MPRSHQEAASPPATDQALVAGARAGDAASREDLVRTHGPRLLAVARRLLANEDDAHDCVQEAFLQAFRNLHRFEGRSTLATWLHRILVNAALMQLRARERRREEPIDDLLPRFAEDGHRVEPAAARPPAVEAALEREDTTRLVRAAIARLPESYRIVLVLRDIEGYETGETAALLETTSGAVKVRLHRARAALKTLLESRWEEQEG